MHLDSMYKNHNISLFIEEIHVSNFEINVWVISRDTGSEFKLLEYLLTVDVKACKI